MKEMKKDRAKTFHAGSKEGDVPFYCYFHLVQQKVQSVQSVTILLTIHVFLYIIHCMPITKTIIEM